MHSLRENDENQAYNFISDFIPALQYSTTAFPFQLLSCLNYYKTGHQT